MMKHMLWVLFCVALAPLACDSGSSGGGSADADVDTDTDTDMDSDTDSDTDTDTDTDSDTDTDVDTDTDTDTTELPFTIRVDDAPADTMIGGAHIAIDPDGAIYVSWVDVRNGERDIFVTRSTDGGASFEPGVMVDGAGTVPIVSGPMVVRHPFLAVDDTRLAVAFSTDTGNGDPYSRVLLTTSPTGGDLVFGDLAEVGTAPADDFEDFARPAISPDGDIYVSWLASFEGSHYDAVSIESDGFAPMDITASSGVAGMPCECCPHDLLFSSDGDALHVFRDNEDDIRNQMALIAPSGTGNFSEFAQVSFSDWYITYCPAQGPRAVETSEGSMLATWAEASTGEFLVWVSTSDDLGASWFGDAPILESLGDGQRNPSIAASAAGPIYIAFDIMDLNAALTVSDDGGETFGEAEIIETPDGVMFSPELAHNAGITAFIGVTASATVWLVRLE